MVTLGGGRRGAILKRCLSGGLTALGFGESQKLGRALGLILRRPRSSLLQRVSFHPPTPPLASNSTNSGSKTPGHNRVWKGETREGITP